MLVAIIAVLTAAFVASAVSGIAKGIQWLSNINMVLALVLALFVFVVGPTVFILNLLPTAIGTTSATSPRCRRAPRRRRRRDIASWLAGWTIFYWAWWVSWTPFVGMFIARICRGRTIRQFVTGVLLVPSAGQPGLVRALRRRRDRPPARRRRPRRRRQPRRASCSTSSTSSRSRPSTSRRW